MEKNKTTTISRAKSYKEIGDFWDNHDVADYWEMTYPVEFEVDIQSETTYFRLERKLAAEVRKTAAKQGISSETLLNQWIKDKLKETGSSIEA